VNKDYHCHEMCFLYLKIHRDVSRGRLLSALPRPPREEGADKEGLEWKLEGNGKKEGCGTE